MDRVLTLAIVLAVVTVAAAMIRTALARRRDIDQIDPADFPAGSDVVVFTSPYCHGCREWLDALGEDSVDAHAIDISKRPEAAARYRISSTPRVAVIDDSGAVIREFDHHAPRRSDLDAIGRILAAH
jgi:hypothetical protein